MTLNSNSYLCGLSLYTRIDDNEEHHLQNFDSSTPSGDMCAHLRCAGRKRILKRAECHSPHRRRIAFKLQRRWWISVHSVPRCKSRFRNIGETYEYQDYNDLFGAVAASISWRRFDLDTGCVFDNFHKMELVANLSWTYCFKRKK